MKKTQLQRKPTTLVRKPIRKGSSILSRSSVKVSPQGKSGPNKKPLKKKSKAWKFVKTHLQECDSAFSREIRERDRRCMFPGCKVEDFANLQASHYFGRANWNTRFDPDNMIALCMFHHFKSKDLGYEYQKQRKDKHGWDGQYTLFMQKWLGQERWEALLLRAEGDKKRKDAILETQRKYNLRQPKQDNEAVGFTDGVSIV